MHSDFFLLKAVCCLNMNSQNVKCKDKEDYLDYTVNLETGKKIRSSARKSHGVFLEQECRMIEMPGALA